MTGGSAVARLGVLLSGRGSNFLAIQHAIAAGDLPAKIVQVVSNVEGAAGLTKARELGLATAAVVQREGEDRLAQERRVIEALASARVDWVCLAGYMRLLSPEFVQRFPRRIVNIHPSLLPSFPGLDAHGQALEHGVRISGCTVHLVDEGMDTGPIIVQRAVPVLDGDDAESLAARILIEEHRAYPEALRLLLEAPWEVAGRKFFLREKASG
ncbi:MAG: phosphoribosylglycinamide formyltransferase [Acidobacteriota bacterium]